MNKTILARRILLSLLLCALLLSVVAPALAAGITFGGSSTGGGNATQSSNGAFSIPYGATTDNIFGYRFTLVYGNGNTNWDFESRIDVMIKDWAGRYRPDKRYSKTEYTQNWMYYLLNSYQYANKPISVTMRGDNDEKIVMASSLGFQTALPSSGDIAAGLRTWAGKSINLRKLGNAMGVNIASSLASGMHITVEPIFGVCIEGTNCIMTVAEIAAYGRDHLGPNDNGTRYGTGSSQMGFIARFTNRNFPNTLYLVHNKDNTPYGEYDADGWFFGDATNGCLTANGTFSELLTKSYGVGIISTSFDGGACEHTLTINPNGGTWNNDSSVQSFLMECNAKRVIEVPQRSGYRFAGWTLSTGGTTGTGSYSLTMPHKDLTLTANWEPIASGSVTLTFTGDSGVASIWCETCGHELLNGAESCTQYSTHWVTMITKTGYTLKQFAGTPYNNASGYQVWTACNGQTSYRFDFDMNVNRSIQVTTNGNRITFDANGGTIPASGNMGTASIQEAHGSWLSADRKTGHVIVRPGSSNFSVMGGDNPTRAGYEFTGWYTNDGVQVYDKDGVWVQGSYWNGGTWAYDGDLTVYAHWDAITTINYDLGGGSIGNVGYDGHKNGEFVNPTSIKYSDAWFYVTAPTRTGYTFAGWIVTGMDSCEHAAWYDNAIAKLKQKIVWHYSRILLRKWVLLMQ